MFEILRRNHMRVVQGDTASFTINVENYNFVEGDIVYFTVKENVQDSKYAIQKIVKNFDGNVVRFNLSSSDTNIDVGDYFYDIQVSLANGIVDTVVLPSKFEVIGGITND